MTKEERAEIKKLRVKLGIDKYQAEMIKKKIKCKRPKDIAKHFVNV